MKDNNEYVIDKSSFEFVQSDSFIHDQKLETKPVGYLTDAWRRFRKNKGSVFAACIILVLFLFAIIAPIASPYDVTFKDPYYKTTLPMCTASMKNQNIDFWDGCSKKELSQTMFDMYYAINVETGQTAVKRGEYKVKSVDEVILKTVSKKGGKVTIEIPVTTNYYTFRLNSYYKIGNIYKNLTVEEYENVQRYQDEHGVQILYPVVAKKDRITSVIDERDKSGAASKAYVSDEGNYWYKVKFNDYTENIKSYVPVADRDENGNYINVYAKDSTTEFDNYTSRMLIEGDTKQYKYAIKNQSGYEVRINYYEYFCYTHTIANDGIKAPLFGFGTNGDGQDILTCLSKGARFSFMLALIVSLINLVIGTIYGAIEGYYGGALDIVMERISDILGAIPLMIVLTLVRMQLSNPEYNLSIKSENIAIISLLISFLATGWIGMAGSVRMQFYRYKNQEYILAARTLGASDGRIMFKHIFPNAIGTLITGCVLVVPSVIFSESSLAYLGILDLSTSTSTSVGVLLANGEPYLSSYPHVILFPALFIALLMLSFNLFGNGLRDAFNPSLRGSEG